jgi:hypothetical protein
VSVRTASILLVGLLCLGCGGAPRFGRASGTVATLSLRHVEWNPNHAEVGRVQAVADASDEVVVFSDLGATVMVSGQAIAVDRSVTHWASATTIPAPDGTGSWIVGIDAEGKVRRLRARSALEAVSERFGLGKDRVREVTSLGAGLVAFALQGQIALADSNAVLRYDLGTFRALAGGGGRAVALFEDAMRVMDPTHHRDATFRLEGARHVAMDDSGRLFAATAHALYAENDRGQLALRYLAAGVEIRGLVASGKRVWFSEGSELGVIEDDHVEASSGAAVPEGARLFPSSTGDVWALSSVGLLRFARDAGGMAKIDAWQRDISPVFARACAKCHRPGGPSGVDLSTSAAWETKRADIAKRVSTERSMPPEGNELSEEDRRAVEAWLAHPK